MAFSNRGDDADITDINVTPLVDITLVLLLVFMVTAKLVMSHALPLDLPQAGSADTVNTVLTIAIDQTGMLMANGKPVADTQALVIIARSEREKTPDLRAVVAASRQVAHGRVVEARDGLRLAGVSKVAFAAEKAP